MKTENEIIQEVMREVAKMPVKDVLEDLNMLIAEEVAEKLKIAESTVHNLVNQGKLPASKFGGNTRFRPRALYAFLLVKERLLQAA